MVYQRISINEFDESAIRPLAWRKRLSLVTHRRSDPEMTRLNIRQWSEDFIYSEVRDLIQHANHLKLVDLRYGKGDLDSRVGEAVDKAAIIGPFQLLDERGVNNVRDECLELLSQRLDSKSLARRAAPIVSTRVRRADLYSLLLYGLARSERLIEVVRDAVGSPVIPHPHRDARVQVNYYGNGDGAARWHRDGMNVVVTILLTDMANVDGGKYVINARSGECHVRGAPYPQNSDLRMIPILQEGQAIVTRGNRIDHCVTPVTKGYRITLAVSFYILGARLHDANRFSHSLPDDGLIRSLGTWWQIKAPWRSDRRLRKLVWDNLRD